MNCGPLCTRKKITLPLFEKLARRYGDTWIWTAFDPVHKLVPAWRVGKRTLTDAKTFIKALKSRLDCHIPFFTSDDLPHYADALLAVYGMLVTPPRRFKQGRPPSPYLQAPPDLVYAVVIKKQEHGHLTWRSTARIIYGTEAQVASLLTCLAHQQSHLDLGRGAQQSHHPSTFASVDTPSERVFQKARVSQVSTGTCFCVLSFLLSTSRFARET